MDHNNDRRVNNPSHYTSHWSGHECIEVSGAMSFMLGSAFKYVWRDWEGLKDGSLSLDKALKYIGWAKADPCLAVMPGNPKAERVIAKLMVSNLSQDKVLCLLWAADIAESSESAVAYLNAAEGLIRNEMPG